MEEKKLTGYPSIDKPWLKYYDEKAINTPLPKCSMYDYLYQCNKDCLDNTALNYFGRKITYKKLFENIDKVAVCLQAAGVKKGDIISVCTLTAPETVYLIYAINKVGAVSNMLGLTSPVQDLHEQLASTDSKLVFAVEMAYDLIVEAAKYTKVEKIVSIPIEYSMPTAIKAAASLKQKHPKLNDMSIKWKEFLTLGEKNTFEPVEIDCETMAVIEYTGGTTGVPKGVMLSNKAINSHYINFYDTNCNKIFSFKDRDRFISGVPFFLVFGLCAACHSPLCHSMELVLAPDPSPAAGARIVLKYKINHVISGRLLIEELITQATNCDLSYVKTLMYGGEETNKNWEKHITDCLSKYNMTAPLQNSYGMSETSAGVLTAINNETDGLIPCANVDVKIINPDNQNEEYGYDTEGELCISTEQLMIGYFKNETDTVNSLFECNGMRWLKTHDLATISSDGIIKITGRIKRIYSRTTQDMIQVRVYPMRIEEELSRSEYVERCAVVGVKDEIVAYRSIAYIILKDKTLNSETVKAELDKLCRENLPESHIPDEYRFVESFPLTRAGKVDFRTLEKMSEESHT